MLSHWIPLVSSLSFSKRSHPGTPRSFSRSLRLPVISPSRRSCPLPSRVLVLLPKKDLSVQPRPRPKVCRRFSRYNFCSWNNSILGDYHLGGAGFRPNQIGIAAPFEWRVQRAMTDFWIMDAKKRLPLHGESRCDPSTSPTEFLVGNLLNTPWSAYPQNSPIGPPSVDVRLQHARCWAKSSAMGPRCFRWRLGLKCITSKRTGLASWVW